ncbi:hypothetical protein P879_09917 [Paragonimus westermani]|uniref:Uncharacterized protein n=1 Tax=Paragonimus westermani TaxID=34504 RepID=A0A8T0D955_9TREM|nr:hypothetical protein P879_09917 [Paragonimus westermani]
MEYENSQLFAEVERLRTQLQQFDHAPVKDTAVIRSSSSASNVPIRHAGVNIVAEPATPSSTSFVNTLQSCSTNQEIHISAYLAGIRREESSLLSAERISPGNIYSLSRYNS